MWKSILAMLLALSGQTAAQNSFQEYLEPVLAPDLMSVTHLEIVSTSSVELLSEDGVDYLALHVFAFQPKLNNGIRAEISVDMPYPADAIVTYQWHFRLPANSGFDNQNRWWVMAQWHDQPDTNIGETWDTKPDTSPAIALGHGVIDGVDHFGFSYGAPEQANIALIPFSRGVWHDMKMVIDWSLGPDGSAAFYIDDMATPVATASGRNMYNNFRNYWKLGTYRSPDIHVKSTVHIGGLRITAN